MKDLMLRSIVATTLAATVLMTGCVTLESPDTKYVMTNEGFMEVSKPAIQQSAEESAQQKVASPSVSTSTDPVKKRIDSSEKNKREAWGSCCIYGRGTNPEPMSAFEFSYPLDLDIAYLRIKREFGFKSREDFALNPPTQRAMDGNRFFHLRFEATPGVHYKMRNWVKHPYGSEESSNTIEVELFKDGANKVKVRVAYYSGNTLDAKGYVSSLRQRIERVLAGS